ncbi:MAG: radical SAM protein [Nitrospiraceae bacterium]|nr:radical SAM protein [Nitrospiraceae bacterium]
MKIVLILPPFDIASSLGGEQRVVRGVLPPLGLGYIAAAVEARGHTVQLLDGCALQLGAEQLVARALELAPDLVGVSCLSKLAESAYEMVRILKGRAPNVPVVMGGAHVTSFADTILLDCPEIDVLVPGEGEIVFADLVDRMERGEGWHTLDGIVYRDEAGEVVATPTAKPVRRLDDLPHVARHIFDASLYSPLPNQARRKPATTAITSRGCPWGKCQFCFQGGRYASPYRRRSPENVVEELVALARDYGIREVLFWDDNFCANSKWVNRFCDLLDESGVDLTWTVLGRVNTVNEAMLKRIAKSGCYSVYFGFESGLQEQLDLVQKGATLDQARDAVCWARKAGLEIRASFIFGLPTDTPQKAEQSLRFACELNPDWVVFFPFHLRPGTPIEAVARREGTVLKEDVDVHLPSYVPKGYESREQLAAVVKRAYRKYYLRPRFIAGALWRARKPSVLKNYLSAFRYWLELVGHS